jgi:hypothetical protein
MSPNSLNIPEDRCFLSPMDIEKSMLSTKCIREHPSLLSLL